ncbi:hypothetical protein NUW58_g8736 [Xylaria curta]|uniref:Uncharacterized protein n=1 Tax=Xylaria curta TaxID=42375 RepID=A0ACC1N5Q9_9PEZI|nr:hypothetical protein NUW58_g8736 [Xylaria curta]
MKYPVLRFLASIAVVSTVSALAFTPENQHHIGSDDILDHKPPNYDTSAFKCNQQRPLDPGFDGLLSSFDLFSSEVALEIMVERHQSLVRIPSVCYDDLGEFGEDERWEPFYNVSQVLQDTYPNVYKYAKVETVNKFGLVYTITGYDESLAPVLLTAHQDVVPVEEATIDRWEHPPFSAFYNETDGYLWGRGASDDKARVTALMSAMEALLDQEAYQPRRTVIFAFGFDEECSGPRGAAHIAEHLEQEYGEGGIAVILDEGGAGLQPLGDALYALPAVYEKGYLDVWFDLDVVGGHSSVPTPNTAIGIMSEIVVALESNPFEPRIDRNSPVHKALICLARYSPDVLPELTDLIDDHDLEGAADFLARLSRDTQYFIQTSQSVNWIVGGQKINALPEFVTLGVNHRYAPQDSIGSIQYRIVKLVEDIVEKYGLDLKAFEGDKDYERYFAAKGITSQGRDVDPSWVPVYDGTLTLEGRKRSYITPQSPTSGPIWDVFAGTVRHTFRHEAETVVVAPGAMTGNTDSRHYLRLSDHIYRWSPGSLASFGNIHTINERLLMTEQLNMAKFYYDFMRNFDQADV